MTADNAADDRAFVQDVESRLGRRLSSDEAALAVRLRPEKTAALVARELAGAVVADPKKIRPEHSDTADE